MALLSTELVIGEGSFLCLFWLLGLLLPCSGLFFERCVYFLGKLTLIGSVVTLQVVAEVF